MNSRVLPFTFCLEASTIRSKVVKNQISAERVKKIWSDAFSVNIPQEKLYFRQFLILCLIINIIVATSVGALSYFKVLPPQVPLFYGSPEGEDQLAANWMLIIPSVCAILFLIINSAISYFMKDEFLKKTLTASVFIATLLSIVTTLKIIGLVGNL